MLPSEIARCLQRSDIYPVISERGIETQMISFLTGLMLEDQFWGSVVENAYSEEPLCFGSCIFVSNHLARRLSKGEFPFLLVDLCQNQSLRTHILSFDEIEKQGKQSRLSFGEDETDLTQRGNN